MALGKKIIREAVDRYWREMDRYSKLAGRVAEICREDIVEDNAIRAQVTFRAKSPKKLEGKLFQFMKKPKKKKKLSSVEKVFAEVGDLGGVRISTYEERDRDRVVEKIKLRFDGPKGQPVDVDKKDGKAKSEYYRATHCQVVLKPDELVGTYENLNGLSCEIQVCSMLAHVWNEIEHDLGYKPTTGELSDDEKEFLEQLGDMTKTADTTIKQLIEATEERQKQSEGAFEDVFDFVTRMRQRFPGAGQFGENSGQLYEDLRRLELISPAKLEEEGVVPENPERAGRELVRGFSEWLAAAREDGVELNAESSDLLLLLLLESRCDKVLELHPMGRGKGRPPRIAMIAVRYKKMKDEAAAAAAAGAAA